MIKIHDKWLDGPCCLQDKPVLHGISALFMSDNPECQLKQLLYNGLADPIFPLGLLLLQQCLEELVVF